MPNRQVSEPRFRPAYRHADPSSLFVQTEMAAELRRRRARVGERASGAEEERARRQIERVRSELGREDALIEPV